MDKKPKLAILLLVVMVLGSVPHSTADYVESWSMDGELLSGGGGSPSPDTIPRVVVSLFEEEIPSDIEMIVAPYGEIIARNETLAFVAVKTDEGMKELFISSMRSRDDVEAAYHERYSVTMLTPSDEYYPEQWGLTASDVNTAWDTSTGTTAGLGSHDAKVAVIDSGISRHPDVEPNTADIDPVCGPDYDFIKGDPSPSDPADHGTGVSSIVGAVTNNGTGIAGISQSCLMDLRVANSEGNAYSHDMAIAIVYATHHEADIIQISMGTKKVTVEGDLKVYPPLLARATDFAWKRGVLLVAANGNQPQGCRDYVCYPAASPDVIAVSGLQDVDSWWGDSAVGPETEIAAAASAVPVASSDSSIEYKKASGTSVAAPHVAGTAALMLSVDETLDHNTTRCLLQVSADDLGSTGRDPYFGYGRLDADEALGYAEDPLTRPVECHS